MLGLEGIGRFKPLVPAAIQSAAAFLVTWFVLTFVPLSHLSWSLLSTPLAGMQYSGATLALVGLEHLALPAGTKLLLIGPFDALLAICLVGAILSVLVAVPVGTALMVRAMGRVVEPGKVLLKPTERSAIRTYGALAGGLFAGGFLITLLLVVPAMYQWSAMLAPAVGAEESVALLQFLSASLVIPLLSGLSFEIPTMALALARLGILTTATMRRHWRGAVLGCFVLALMISPGVGGGVLEAAFGIGLSALFGVSFLLVRRAERIRSSTRRTDVAPA